MLYIAEKVKAEVQKVKDQAQSVADVISAGKSVAEEKLEKAIKLDQPLKRLSKL